MSDLEAALAAIPKMSTVELADRWQALGKGPAPRVPLRVLQRLQAYTWIETETAFGQMRQEAQTGPDTFDGMVTLLLDAGGVLPEGSRRLGRYLGIAGRTESGKPCCGYSCTGTCFDIGITTRQALMRFKASGDPIAGSIDPNTAGKPRQEIRASGYVAHSLEASLWSVARSGTFAEAVLLAANLGEDADTNAAITGQLAGALFGASEIPQVWQQRLAQRGYIQQLASELYAVMA